MTDATYTLDDIKKAFWKEFHCAGELWFVYPPFGDKMECEQSTESFWWDFVESLNGENKSD